MAEEAATKLDFTDRETLEAWLRTQPPEVAVAIAADRPPPRLNVLAPLPF